jgi:hypothetical protein
MVPKKMNLPAQFLIKIIVIREYFKRFFRVEKNKINRQYFRAPALSGDEAGHIPHYQHNIYEKQSHPSDTRRDWSMGNVHVYFRIDNFFLGNWYCSVASASLSQE